MRAFVILEVLAVAVVLGRGSPGGADETADAGTAATTSCMQAIGPGSAQGLYAALKDLRGSDACVLADVRTERSVMHVVWTKAGVAVPAIEIRPAACAVEALLRGPQFSLAAPPEFATACPVALEKLKAIVTGDTLGAAVDADGHSAITIPLSAIFILGGGLGLLAIAGGIVVVRRRRKRRA